MFEILTAIKSKGNDLASSFPGGFYFRHVPRTPGQAEPEMPYAVYTVEADRPDENTGAGYVQLVRVRFEVYAKSALDFKTAAQTLKDNFYRKPLTLSDGRVIAADLADEGIDDEDTEDDTQPQTFYYLAVEFTQTQTRA
jgi:hypothetical protein